MNDELWGVTVNKMQKNAKEPQPHIIFTFYQ